MAKPRGVPYMGLRTQSHKPKTLIDRVDFGPTYKLWADLFINQRYAENTCLSSVFSKVTTRYRSLSPFSFSCSEERSWRGKYCRLIRHRRIASHPFPKDYSRNPLHVINSRTFLFSCEISAETAVFSSEQIHPESSGASCFLGMRVSYLCTLISDQERHKHRNRGEQEPEILLPEALHIISWQHVVGCRTEYCPH